VADLLNCPISDGGVFASGNAFLAEVFISFVFLATSLLVGSVGFAITSPVFGSLIGFFVTGLSPFC